MFITVKINKTKIIMTFVMLLLILIVSVVGYKLLSHNYTQSNAVIEDNQLNSKIIKYLESFGWRVEGQPDSIEEFTLPNEFNIIYKRYNQYQLDIGRDLTQYKGQKVKRYTYKVLNYNTPSQYAGQQVYADVFVYNNQIIGGDLKTNELNGFLVSLKNRTFKQITGIEEWEYN